MVFPFIRNICGIYLAVEVYKTVVEINPEFMWTYFLKNPIFYNLRKIDKVFYLLQDQQNTELVHFCSEAVFFGITYPPRSKIMKH